MGAASLCLVASGQWAHSEQLRLGHCGGQGHRDAAALLAAETGGGQADCCISTRQLLLCSPTCCRCPPTPPPRRISPAKEQGWGFSVNVKEGGTNKADVYCSVSDAELRLIKTLLTVGRAARGRAGQEDGRVAAELWRRRARPSGVCRAGAGTVRCGGAAQPVAGSLGA